MLVSILWATCASGTLNAAFLLKQPLLAVMAGLLFAVAIWQGSP